MPIVRELVEDARLKIMQLTGVLVRISVEEIPADQMEQMLAYILDRVCETFDVSTADMKSVKRTAITGLVDARHTFFYIAHELRGISCTRVGAYCKRDHTTVLHACNKIAGFYHTNDDVIIKVNQVIDKIKCV